MPTGYKAGERKFHLGCFTKQHPIDLLQDSVEGWRRDQQPLNVMFSQFRSAAGHDLLICRLGGGPNDSVAIACADVN